LADSNSNTKQKMSSETNANLGNLVGVGWLKMMKIEDVRNEDALITLTVTSAIYLGVVCYTWPHLPELVFGRLANGVSSLANAPQTKYLVIGTLLAVAIGIGGSTVTRSYNHAPKLFSKLAVSKPSPDMSLIDLLRPDQSADQLIDACNDLDYAFQALALMGATPYVVPFRVMPEFVWKQIIIPLARRLLCHGWNMFVRTILFVDRCWSHLWERITVVYHLAVRFGNWFFKTLVEPILRFVLKVSNLVGSLISAIVTAICDLVSRFVSAIFTIFSTITKFVVNTCIIPTSEFISSSFYWLSQLVSDAVNHLTQTIQRLFV
jgi:hypothetical protein